MIADVWSSGFVLLSGALVVLFLVLVDELFHRHR